MSTVGKIEDTYPATVPTPPSFPVTWDSPEDAQIFWTLDRMHFPEQMTPMAGWLISEPFDYGFNGAAESYDIPLRAHSRVVNTYFYQSFAPLVLPQEEMEAMGRRSQEKLMEAMARLSELWETEWLPEIQSHLAFWEEFDLRDSSIRALLNHLEETVKRHRRMWELHFLIVFPSYLAVSLFDEFYRDLFGEEGVFDAYRLLEGFDNKTLQTGRVMWALSRLALSIPEAKQTLMTAPPVDARTRLKESSGGRAFLAELQSYLEVFGKRPDKSNSLTSRSWIEDPTPVIENLRGYMAQPDRDLQAEMDAQAAERERRVAETRERLKGYPRPVVDQFEFLLKAAHVGCVLTEDHGYWIDYKGQYQVRMVLLELGRRFEQTGVIEVPEDIFYLHLDEIRHTVDPEWNRIDRRRLVAQRKAEMEQFRSIEPPPAIGTLPSGAPPDNPVARAIGKIFGVPLPAAEAPGVVKGHAGSPGKVTGTAKVVRSLAESGRLRKGDVLVAETTAPPWTPLFRTVSAVVTDAGGVLSHCAVVAREYGIPAVVGTGNATVAVRDGQRIEVDGNAGVVRVLE